MLVKLIWIEVEFDVLVDWFDDCIELWWIILVLIEVELFRVICVVFLEGLLVVFFVLVRLDCFEIDVVICFIVVVYFNLVLCLFDVIYLVIV